MKYNFVRKEKVIGIMLFAFIFLFTTIVAAKDEPAKATKEPAKATKEGTKADDDDKPAVTKDESLDEVKKIRNEEVNFPDTKRDIKGIVVDMLSGEAVPGATVSLLNVKVETGADGRFVFKGVNDYHAIQMTARIMTDLDVVIGCSYFFVPTTYYPISANKTEELPVKNPANKSEKPVKIVRSDVKIINMLESSEDIILKIADYSLGNVDKFCDKCHESSPCLIEEEYGKAADGKVKLKGLLVRQSELEKYIAKMKQETMNVERYSKIRYLDNHPSDVDVTASVGYNEGRIRLPEDMMLKEGKIIVCDTCHTRHVPTEWGQFVIMDFVKRESICLKCHK